MTTRDDLARISAAQHVAFASPGTAAGEAGTEALDAVAREADPAVTAFLAERMERGLTITAAAFVDGEPVAAGAHQPVDGATEIVGVGCLPAFRRRGLAAAVTSRLVADALERGVGTVCLSADDRRRGTALRPAGIRDGGIGGCRRTPSGLTPPSPQAPRPGPRRPRP